MKFVTVIAMVLCVVALGEARPKFFAIPVEDIQFLSFSPVEHHRVTRQAPALYAPSAARAAQAPGPYALADAASASSEGRPARHAHGHGHDGHDYVDYGAHTGHHGAFGWYADFPVHAHEH